MGFKIKNAPVLVRKMQFLDSRGNFGQGFRRGRRKMGSNKQNYVQIKQSGICFVYISVISATLEYVSLFHESTLLHRVTSYRFYRLQVYRFFSLEFSVGSFGSVVQFESVVL